MATTTDIRRERIARLRDLLAATERVIAATPDSDPWVLGLMTRQRASIAAELTAAESPCHGCHDMQGGVGCREDC